MVLCQTLERTGCTQLAIRMIQTPTLVVPQEEEEVLHMVENEPTSNKGVVMYPIKKNK